MLRTYEQHSRRKLVSTVLAVIVIAGLVLFTDSLQRTSTGSAASASPLTTTMHTSATPAPAPATTSSAANMAPPSPAPPSSGFQDGTYTAASGYYVPHGRESIEVSVTLKDGIITNSSVRNSEGNDQSAAYQQDFASIYKSYVVGKKISSLQLDIIAGASDTTQGFDNALSQITKKAQA